MKLSTLCVALILVAGAVPTVQAQVITNAEIERGLRFRGPAFDGEPYTQRYSYTPGNGMIYFGSANNLWYMHYLDRADRAEKFGYAMPFDPYFEETAPVEEGPAVVEVAPPARVYIGGMRLWRRR